jgi:hypothetical protein
MWPIAKESWSQRLTACSWNSIVIDFKIVFLARIEVESRIIIRRRPITQPKTLS